MADEEEQEDWQAKDAIAEELDLSQSSPTRKTFDEADGHVSTDEEAEVLIKTGKLSGSGDEYDQPTRKWSPRKDAFFFSKYISYFWMTSLLVKGSEKPLEQDDLEGVMPDDCVHPLTEALERNWYQEAYDENGKMKEKPSLGKALIKTFGMQYLLVGFFPFLSEIVRIIQPVFMGEVIEYFQFKDRSSKSEAYAYAFGMVLCFFINSWTIVPFNYLRQKYGVQVRVACTGLVYKKVMNLSCKTLARSTTGFIVNLVSNDATRFEFASYFLHYLWIGPIELIIITYLLVKELGPTALSGIGALILLAPIQLVMGRLIMHFRRKILKHSDQRVKIMNEIIAGIKVIKLYTWENSFTEWIKKLRHNELKEIRHLAWVRASIMSFFFSAGAFVSFITFMTYVLAGNTLTPQKVFTTLALFNVARLMMTLYFPIGITLFNEGRVAVERFQKILVEEDMNEDNTASKALRPKLEDCGVKLNDVTASWTEDAVTVQDISSEVKAGELLAVVGPVGSGKSSLLMAILGELPLSKGNVDVKGKVAYASQEPWIFNGTLKYNITFGHDFDKDRYNDVLEACALTRDIELFELGDQTLVGERGVSLSGGQKARVNLARAVYSDADVFIMDDPLSAVDAHVGRHLYERCINGYLADKVRILVTHQLQYLTNADIIMSIGEGKCIGQGTFQELSEMGINLLDNDVEENDLASEDELEKNALEAAKRRFSRAISCRSDELEASEFSSPIEQLQREISLQKQISLQRQISFQRQITQSSCRSRIDFTESSIAIANDLTEAMTLEEQEQSVLPKELKVEGSIGSEVYSTFFAAGYGKLVWFAIIVLFVICQVVFVFADWWLSKWSEEEARANGQYDQRRRDLGIYAFLVFSLIALGLTRALLFFQVMLKATANIHMVMFNSLMKAPLYFFDTNSIGRILNRFSKDSSLVDDMLGFSLFDLLQSGLVVVGIFFLVSIKLPLILALVFPIIIAFVMLRVYYIKTAREIKRIEGLARSPIFGHFSTTLLGLPTIRSFRVQDKFFDILAEVQDKHTESYMTFLGCSSWLSFNLDLLCGMFISFTCFVCVIFSDNFDAGAVGLMLAYAIGIPGSFQQCVRQSTEVENQFTSVERILEYGTLEPEELPKDEASDVKPPSEWPARGSVVFDGLNFSYHKTLPNILHHVSAHIKSKEKIGVCGRTGAGKSSLLSTLFRTSEPTGLIQIDGIDISKLALQDLRSKISIIPQEPIIFSGTMRMNLDPFDNYTDEELWQVLEEVRLKEAVSELPGKLESVMAESGGNLSVGQKQLVCLARAIMKHNRILVIDEATANVDPRTDGLIQETIRDKFRECTVLTIAHRLHTIMDSDRIMVLDAGRLKEFDEPFKLLRCKNSILHSLVANTGPDEAQKLFEMSIKAHVERNKSAKINEDEVQMGDCGENCKCHNNVDVIITPTHEEHAPNTASENDDVMLDEQSVETKE